jgi:hypothetical protein
MDVNEIISEEAEALLLGIKDSLRELVQSSLHCSRMREISVGAENEALDLKYDNVM